MGIYIETRAAMKYYMLATLSGDREIGGYAEYRIDEHLNVIVTDLFALKQKSTSVYFEIEDTENAKFLEQTVADGKDPLFRSMLFHTHPTGMGASMSSTDVDQLEEMAKDLPGTIARSMILSQGKIHPVLHEAVCIDGKVFHSSNTDVKLLDDTGTTQLLKDIGWHDKPAAPPAQRRYVPGAQSANSGARQDVSRAHMTSGPYGQSVIRQASAGAPLHGNDYASRTYGHGVEKGTGYTEDVSESRAWSQESVAAYADYLDQKQDKEWLEGLDLLDARDKFDEAVTNAWIGEAVTYLGGVAIVVDAYTMEDDKVILVMPDGAEVESTHVAVVPTKPVEEKQEPKTA